MTLEQAAEALRHALKAYDHADAAREAADEARQAAECSRRAASLAISDARDNLIRIAAGVGDLPPRAPDEIDARVAASESS